MFSGLIGIGRSSNMVGYLTAIGAASIDVGFFYSVDDFACRSDVVHRLESAYLCGFDVSDDSEAPVIVPDKHILAQSVMADREIVPGGLSAEYVCYPFIDLAH